MAGHPHVILFICVSLNIFGTQSADRIARNFSPNFEPDHPHFTPFNNAEFIQMSSNLRVGDVHEEPILPARGPHHHHHHHLHAQKPAEQSSNHVPPFKSFVMDLYQKYRSTYMSGNHTIGQMLGVSPSQIEEVISENTVDDEPTDFVPVEQPAKKEKRRKNKIKRKHEAISVTNELEEVKYNVGPGVNISMDTSKELVNVYLDEDCLKDVFTGRGRKQDLISKILPLFILPFLIQSAVIPFAVTTLKLLLVKSIVVGKIAIFLLIISALKSHTKYSNAYDAPTQYVVDPPSRRSEAIAGYRVEGRPTTWVN